MRSGVRGSADGLDRGGQPLHPRRPVHDDLVVPRLVAAGREVGLAVRDELLHHGSHVLAPPRLRPPAEAPPDRALAPAHRHRPLRVAPPRIVHAARHARLAQPGRVAVGLQRTRCSRLLAGPRSTECTLWDFVSASRACMRAWLCSWPSACRRRRRTRTAPTSLAAAARGRRRSQRRGGWRRGRPAPWRRQRRGSTTCGRPRWPTGRRRPAATCSRRSQRLEWGTGHGVHWEFRVWLWPPQLAGRLVVVKLVDEHLHNAQCRGAHGAVA